MVSVITIIILVVVAIIVLWLIAIFNSLITLRNDVKKAFSGIDVQLKRRTDLIPNLVNTVKGYAKHEEGVLEKLTQARTSIMNAGSDVKKLAQGEDMLSGALKSVFAVAENYPDLKANQNFLELQKQLEETEDQIAASRRIYNENSTHFNTKLQVFPNNFVSGMLGFKESDLFEATQTERKEVEVKF